MHDGARMFTHPSDLLSWALDQAPPGLTCEFGVGAGVSLTGIAAKRFCYGFDSFNGLPEHWRQGYPKGCFACAPPDIANTELVVGLFEDTLPGWLATHAGPITFAHIDCDLYSSAKTVLTHIAPRLIAGTVIVLDEYFNAFNCADWPDGERRALAEAPVRSRHIGSAWEAAAVVVT